MTSIRMFEPSDLESCGRVLVDASRGALGGAASPERARKYLEDVYGMVGFGGLVAVENGRTVGFLIGFRRHWLDGDEFHVAEFCVDPARSGVGIADELLVELKKVLVGKGYRSVEVMASRTDVAMHFFERHGFHPDHAVQHMRAPV